MISQALLYYVGILINHIPHSYPVRTAWGLYSGLRGMAVIPPDFGQLGKEQ